MLYRRPPTVAYVRLTGIWTQSFRLLGLTAGLIATLCAAAEPHRQPSASPSAEQSDPRPLGWMEGVPRPPDKLITQPDSHYFSFPNLRWTV